MSFKMSEPLKRPQPIIIKSGERKVAAAYAKRAPTSKKKDWSWVMHYGSPILRDQLASLEGVEGRMFRAECFLF
jgi:hypothetical protein